MLEGSVVTVNAKGVEGGSTGGSGDIGGGMGGFELGPGPGRGRGKTIGAGVGAGPNNSGRESLEYDVCGDIGVKPHFIIAKSETYQVDTTDILFILSGAFVGLDKVVQQRLAKGVC